MSARVWAVFLLCLICETAFADTLVMKSGENKKGRILEETEKSVLFNCEADGVVVEVPKNTIAIVDRDIQNQESPSKGSVQVFSVPPKKKTKWVPREPEQEGDLIAMPPNKPVSGDPNDPLAGQAANFQSFVKLIEDWVRSHPEAEKYIQEWMKKFSGKEDEIEKLIKTAKEA